MPSEHRGLSVDVVGLANYPFTGYAEQSVLLVQSSEPAELASCYTIVVVVGEEILLVLVKKLKPETIQIGRQPNSALLTRLLVAARRAVNWNDLGKGPSCSSTKGIVRGCSDIRRSTITLPLGFLLTFTH